MQPQALGFLTHFWLRTWFWFSSTLAWKIPWMGEPGRLQSMGSQRVRHDWATSLSLPPFLLIPTLRAALIPAAQLRVRSSQVAGGQVRWQGMGGCGCSMCKPCGLSEREWQQENSSWCFPKAPAIIVLEGSSLAEWYSHSSTLSDKHLHGWFSNSYQSPLKTKSGSERCSGVSDCTVHGILQARILEWVAYSFSRGSSPT